MGEVATRVKLNGLATVLLISHSQLEPLWSSGDKLHCGDILLVIFFLFHIDAFVTAQNDGTQIFVCMNRYHVYKSIKLRSAMDQKTIVCCPILCHNYYC